MYVYIYIYIYIYVTAYPSTRDRAAHALRVSGSLGTRVGGGFKRGGFKIFDFAYDIMASSTVVTRTQFAVTYASKGVDSKHMLL